MLCGSTLCLCRLPSPALFPDDSRSPLHSDIQTSTSYTRSRPETLPKRRARFPSAMDRKQWASLALVALLAITACHAASVSPDVLAHAPSPIRILLGRVGGSPRARQGAGLIWPTRRQGARVSCMVSCHRVQPGGGAAGPASRRLSRAHSQTARARSSRQAPRKHPPIHLPTTKMQAQNCTQVASEECSNDPCASVECPAEDGQAYACVAISCDGDTDACSSDVSPRLGPLLWPLHALPATRVRVPLSACKAL